MKIEDDIIKEVSFKTFGCGAAVATSSTGTGTTDDVASFTPDDATFTANKLAIVGEKSVFTFTITNDGNVDAVMDGDLDGFIESFLKG